MDLNSPSFACVECCLRLLESYLLGRWDSREANDDVPLHEALNPNRDEIIEGLLSTSLATDILTLEANDDDDVSQSERLILIPFVK